MLAKRRAMDARGEREIPLIVLSGECHTDPRDHLRHMLVLDALRKEESAIGVAYEFEHNRAEQEYVLSGRTLTDAAKAAIAAANDRGALSVRTSYRPMPWRMGLHSRATLFRYLQRSGLPLKFNDCARPYEYKLDFNDPATAQSVEEYYAANDMLPAQELHVSDVEGIGVRNVHMLKHAEAFVHRHGLRILFQQCGDTHVLGGCNGKVMKDSLAYLLKKRDYIAVVALTNEERGRDYNIQADGSPLLTEGEVSFRPSISGVDAVYNATSLKKPNIDWRLDTWSLIKKMIKAHDDTGDTQCINEAAKRRYGDVTKPLACKPSYLENRRAEAFYANSLLSALGRDQDRMSVKTFRRWQLQNTFENEALFARCEHEAWWETPKFPSPPRPVLKDAPTTLSR